MNFADRLFDGGTAKRSPLVVGIDPDPRLIPSSLFDLSSGEKERPGSVGPRRGALCRTNHPGGGRLCFRGETAARLLRTAWSGGTGSVRGDGHAPRDHGLLVIADGKRNDIAQTAKEYAAAYLGGGEGSAKTEGK